MNLDNRLHNGKFPLETQYGSKKPTQDLLFPLNDEETESPKNLLSKFLNWLKEQIDSGNKQFSLDSKDLILYNPSHRKPEFIFILSEVLDRYYDQTKIAPEIIQSELKKALKITFSYTILREEKVIEVFPCMRFF